LFLFIDIITARTAALIIISTTCLVQVRTFFKRSINHVLFKNGDKNIKFYFPPLITGKTFLSEFLFLVFIQRVSGFL